MRIEGMKSSKMRAQFRIKTAQKTDEHSKIFPDMIRFSEIAFEMKLELVLRSPRAKKAAARS